MIPFAQERRFVCKNCDLHWSDYLLVGVLLEVAVLHMKLMRCPKCGSGSDQVCFDLPFEIQELALKAKDWYSGMSKNDDGKPRWGVDDLPYVIEYLVTVARDARTLIHKFAETGHMDPIAMIDLCHALRDYEAFESADQSDIFGFYDDVEMAACNMKVIPRERGKDDDKVKVQRSVAVGQHDVSEGHRDTVE